MNDHKPSDTPTPWKSYAAAAVLGATAAGQAAEAEIIFTDITDVTIGPDAVAPIYINLDGAGQNEFSIASFASSVRVNPYNVGSQDSKVLTAGAYYVNAFAAGDLIGPTSAAAGGARFAARETGSTFYNFVGTNQFIGLQWDIGGGDVLFGYATVDITGDSYSEVEVTLKSFAYESTPNTAIEAGAIPEPGTFALLAAGAGALAFGRRSGRAA